VQQLPSKHEALPGLDGDEQCTMPAIAVAIAAKPGMNFATSSDGGPKRS